MSKVPKKDFVFKKNMSIGEADAENDMQFLNECFIDIGDYDVVENTSNPQSIVIGRTGIGKSALIEYLERNSERVIRIEPESLALRHISNSTILRFFEDIGVNLDIFYNLLWQHTFSVELIKNKYNIDSFQAKTNFIDNISALLTGNYKKQQALKYIEEWGDKFWVDTETRIKEFTEKLESSLQSSISSNVPGVNLSVGASGTLSEEQKSEIIHYGKKVVSTVQIEKLSKIISLLSDDIFNDPQQKTYIVIDRLDENWVEDDLRYKLIKALIETIKKFRNIKPVKIVVTLRTDLLNRVLEKTRDSGFQPEKYNSLYLKMGWNKNQLKELLDKRVNQLLKYKYTNDEVVFDDIFPNKIDKVTSLDYIMERTLLRPRDAIVFVNECLLEAQGKTEITGSIIKKAEQSYSYGRLESLKFEWHAEHPLLDKYIDFLHYKNNRFKVNSISDDMIESLITSLVEIPEKGGDEIVRYAHQYMNSKYPDSYSFIKKIRQSVFYTLFKIGVVGIKVDGVSSVVWSTDRTPNLSYNMIEPNSIVYVHKMLWRCLAIDKRVS